MIMSFWKNKKVLITGVTGFKGSWLARTLLDLGAEVTGFSLLPDTQPNLFNLLELNKNIDYLNGDVRNRTSIANAVQSKKFDIVFHLAAQALVRRAYKDPIFNFETNLLGTLYLLEAIRSNSNIKCVVNVTTDKCYINKNLNRGYTEQDELGGNEPYSTSKACSELITQAYTKSYLTDSGIRVATARAGNVIGGGDWSEDRLVPDLVRSISSNKSITLRNPEATRPWLHVLEANFGYMLLAEKLYNTPENLQSNAWNFGPNETDSVNVLALTQSLLQQWKEVPLIIEKSNIPESKFLMLNSNLARKFLGWMPSLSVEERLSWTVNWYKEFYNNSNVSNLTSHQISNFIKKIEPSKF